MRLASATIVTAALLLSLPVHAQNAPAAAPAPSRHASSLAGMTRAAYLQREEQRAARHFDRLDTNHDGTLQQSEIDAWRAAHPRHAAARTAKPASH